jgi:hypothetical protein
MHWLKHATLDDIQERPCHTQPWVDLIGFLNDPYNFLSPTNCSWIESEIWTNLKTW